MVTAPGYTIPERGARFAGGEVHRLALTQERGFLPDLDAIGEDLWRRAAILWLNYPNNPTGAVAPLAFLREAAERCRAHDVLLASDEAYSELWFEGGPPAGALQVGDLTNVLTINTLSKRSSMTGYRSGFAAGDPALIAALKALRPSVGVTPQEFVQRASTLAWGDESHVQETRAKYEAEARDLPRGVRTTGGRGRRQRGHLLPVGEGPRGPYVPGVVARAPGPGRPGRGAGVVLRPGGRGLRAHGSGACCWTSASERRRSSTVCCRRCRRERSRKPDRTDRTLVGRICGWRRRRRRGGGGRRGPVGQGRGSRRAARGRDLEGEPVGEEGRAAVLPGARHDLHRGGALRVPRQAAAQARIRRAGRAGRPSGHRSLRRVSVARSRPDAQLREHRGLGRSGHDGRHVGDGRLVRADRRRTSTWRAAWASAACSSRCRPLR